MICDANVAWLKLLSDTYIHGEKVVPRGMETREVLGSTVVLDMKRPVLTVAARKLGYRFMCAEAAWIMSGDNRVATIAPFSKHIKNFSDDGESYFGAYGPKLHEQLDYVVTALRKDSNTRQAVANIWRENPPMTKDYPCTLSCQFMIRRNQLHTFITMRSNDVWLGFPYDVFNAAMWSAYVLLKLDLPGEIELGNLYHTAASRHLYATNFEAAEEILADVMNEGSPIKAREYWNYEPFNLWEFNPETLNQHLWALAKKEETPYRWLSELRER